MGRAIAIGAAVALGWASPAAAQMVSSKDPQSLVRAMQAAGFQAKLDKDASGDPNIMSAASGSTFWVHFYNCTENRNCLTVQFQTAWDMTPEEAPSLEKINEWNLTKRFARAYHDPDGDPGLKMDLNLDFGGISEELFKDELAVWASQIGSYKTFIGR